MEWAVKPPDLDVLYGELTEGGDQAEGGGERLPAWGRRRAG